MAKTFNLGLKSYEDLFTTEDERQEQKKEKVIKLQIDEIKDFSNHPYRVEMNEEMATLIDSIEKNGLLMPVMVRPDKSGNGFEMIAGHRRKYALEQLGIKEIDAIVRELSDDEATILMVDSNLHRESICPSEKGKAFKMRLDAMKHQGKRNDLDTSRPIGEMSKYKKNTSIATLSELVGESQRQIQRFIRLTYLIEPLQDMVDHRNKEGIEIGMMAAVELSFLKPEEQEFVVKSVDMNLATPNLSQAQNLKNASIKGYLTQEYVTDLLMKEKANQKSKITFIEEDINQFFPKSFTQKQKHDKIMELLQNWSKRREKVKER